MWSQLVLCLLVGLAYASWQTSPAWRDNKEYVYWVNGRTLSSLHEAADQYSGIFLKAKLHVALRSDGKLQGRLVDPKYAQIQSHLPDGWKSEVPESQLSYKQLSLADKPFQIVLEDGLVKSLIVEKDLSNWEANIIKSIVSQFQLDIQGKRVIPSPMNTLPNSNSDNYNGVFKTMEETVTGETETLYEIRRLPEYLLQSQPWLAPEDSLKTDGYVFEVTKFKNYTNAEERPSYNYGFGHIDETEPSSNKMGQFFIRESQSRAILTGKASKFAIQSSYTVNKIMVNPIFKNSQMGSVISMVNVTLSEVKEQSQQPKDLSNPIDIGNLVYTYENSFSSNNKVHEKLESRVMVDSSSSEESSETTWRRFRRSSSMNSIKQGYQQDSQESMQQQPRPQLSQAPGSPLLPYMVGYHGQSIKKNRDFDVKENAEKLAQEIRDEIQNPEKILSESTLEKYTILSTLVRLMDEDEIKSVAEKLYTNNEQGQERLAWTVYRDAVAEAGTGPAFLNIHQWLESNKIQKREAAIVVSTMAQAVRVPTEDYMRKFFEMVKHSEVQNQEHLNETAILSYTDLIYKVYVNRNESHSQYPSHSFGSFYTKEGKDFVKSTVIPYFAQQLQNAVSQSDAHKIHVYIRALGNIGQRMILEVFEPYLEGQQQVSQFQRMWIVACLDRLAYYNPEVARSVLYRIYQNSAEIPEVRIVAVHQLIKTNPSAEMLQHMAQYTNVDSQEQVNAAVKEVIQSASRLSSVKDKELREAAQSAKPLLTRKQYGAYQSFLELRDFLVQEGANYHHTFLEVGSDDSSVPKVVQLGVDEDMNGMNRHFSVRGMLSSFRELTNVLYQQTEQYQMHNSQRSQQQSNDPEWSSAKVAQLLKYQREEREQLESVIFAEMEHFQKLWSFDNQTLQNLPEAIRQQEDALRNGKKISYSKLQQLKEIALSFPTEMGLPFLYTYDMPVLVRFEGQIKASASPQISKGNKLHKPDQVSGEIDAEITVSAKIQSHLSFVTPFDHQVYMAGYDRNVQAHIPIKGKAEIDVQNKDVKIELEMQERHGDARMLHFSSKPYTSRSDVMTIRPVALRPNTYIINAQSGHKYFDTQFGKKQTGFALRVWGHHSAPTISMSDLIKIWKSANIASTWDQLWDQVALEHTEFNVGFTSGQSTSRKMNLRFRCQQEYNKQPSTQNDEDFLSLSQLSSKIQSDEAERRQQEIIKHANSGIRSAAVSSLDVSVDFQGDKTYQHVFGYAFVKSDADPKSRALIYYKNKDQEKQFVFETKTQVPNTNGLDLTDSLDTEPSAKYDTLIQYGQPNGKVAKISATFDLRRSQERKQHLTNQPLYYVCKEQMQQGNFQLPACQNMTISSNFLDSIDFKVHYENLDQRFAKYFEYAYKGLVVYYYPMTETSFGQDQSENVFRGRVQFQPEHFRQVNITVQTKDEATTFFNLSIPNEYIKTLIVPHPVFHLRSRIAAIFKGRQNFRPTCVIDQTAAQTFSNKTYPLSLDEHFTVAMQYIPSDARATGTEQKTVEEQLKWQLENYIVLTRQASREQKEVIIAFNTPKSQGKTVQIQMKGKQGSSSPSNPAAEVYIDQQQMKFDDKEIADLHDGHVQIYALPNGEVKCEIQDAFYLIFDGQRIKITATNGKLYDSVYGLCGRFSHDQYEDFTTPAKCVARDHKKFAESFDVQDSQQQQRKQRSGEWQQECVQKVLPLYANVISEKDIGKSGSQRGQQLTGSKLRPRYVEENGEICFTLRPVPVCNGKALSTATKNLPVHCVQGTKTAYYLKSQIDQGGNPDFSRKSETRSIRLEVPVNCS